jgi:DNA-binding NarL/FixJ family response regulator
MKKTCVLLAVRHPAMMEGIRGLLETMFDSVVMVSDEISLLETLARLDPDFAVVDLSLDVTRESDVAVLLNRYDPELKFIVLSTHEESEIMEKCMLSGASAYVLKRSAGRDLGKAVDEVLKGGTFVSPSIDVSKQMKEEGS